MKKLMFAIGAVALCGAVFAEEEAVEPEVASQIVGFQTVGNPFSGYFDRGATFNTISLDDGADIQSIIPQVPEGSTTELTDGGFTIQEIDDFGEPIVTYEWLVEGSEQSPDGKAGWYVFDEGTFKYTRAERVFVRGEGFLLTAPFFGDADDHELPSSYQTCGEVNLAAKTVENPYSGYFLRSNYRPLELSIQKIAPVVPKDTVDELTDGGFTLQEIDDFGEPIVTYEWLIDGSEQSPEGKAGWYVFDEGTFKYTLSDKVFAPGEGFILTAPFFGDKDGNELPSGIQFLD